MFHRSMLALVSLLLALPMLGSCTTRYQDLLRDRDADIRELNGRIAQLRAANEDLERREASARGEADELRRQMEGMPKGQPADASLSDLRRELDGADVRYVRGRISIGIEDSVTFDSGSVALKGSSHRILQKIAGVLKSRYSDHRIYVEGHTDTDPIQKTKDRYRNNRHLSTERADAVVRYLIEQGVPERRLVVVGFGQYDPKRPGGDAGSKANNRRCEIVVGERM